MRLVACRVRADSSRIVLWPKRIESANAGNGRATAQTYDTETETYWKSLGEKRRERSLKRRKQ